MEPDDDRRFAPGRFAGIAAVVLALGVGGFFIVDAAATDAQRSDTYGADVSPQCAQEVARIADEQAAAIEEFGANAPNFDFWFPESCFE